MTNARIYVAGHRGMVGSSIVRALSRNNACQIISRTHSELDLTDQSAVRDFFQQEKPEYVFLAAAKVGGILANDTYPADFIYENLAIQANLIHESWRSGAKRLLFLGSSCIYPRECPQPIKEEYLLRAPLEPTNEPYAIAKIAGLKLCESYNRQYGTDFRCVMPCNLYGPGDNYHPENSHVIPALIRRIHEAKIAGEDKVIVWGSGTPRREFLYVDDLAAACVHIMNLDRDFFTSHAAPMQSHINVGTGQDISIEKLAKLISGVIGYSGLIEYDSSRPDGSPRKCLDISRLNSLNFSHPLVDLKEGIRRSYQDFLARRIE